MGPTIVVPGQPPASSGAEQKKEYGTVSFESEPTGAELLLDNGLIGNTPLSNVKLPSGSHSITITLPGYKPWVRQITILPDCQQNIKAKLEQ
jgi:hypothetical protein